MQMQSRWYRRVRHAHEYRGWLSSCCALAVCFLCLIVSVAPTFAQGTGYWHTSGSQILDSNGKVVRLAGVNWYGFETPDFLAHGLWAQDYKTVLNTIKSLGYNVIRIPFSNQMVESNPVPTNFTQSANGVPANAALVGQTALTDLDTIVSYAGSIGLRVILDNHRSEAGSSNEANGLWYTSTYPQTNWINDWTTLATRYSASKFTFSGNPTVIGMDLRNEPHLMANGSFTGGCWTGDTETNGSYTGCPVSLTAQNWPVAAQAAGNAVLAVNPKLLIFVEGNDCYNGSCGWQGGNLEGVATHPVVLNVSGQLVYSAHDYGPNLFQQPWFTSSTTTTSLNAIWNQFWDYISANGTAPVWLGEFGTDNTSTDIENSAAGSQGQWFQTLVAFLQAHASISWTYWALNGEDTYALLDSNYDATPASSLKQSLLASIQAPLGGGATCAAAPSAPTGLTASAASSSQINLSWTAVTPPANCSATYNVFRSTTSGFAPSTSNQVATGLTAATFSNTGLTASTAYFFVVEAVDAAGSSAASAQASATTQANACTTVAAAPTGLTAAATSSSQINLSWTAVTPPSGCTVTYSVFRSTTSGFTPSTSNQVATGLTTVTLSNTGLAASTTYFFVVEAVDGAGSSAASAQASATTQASTGNGDVTPTAVVSSNGPYFNEEDLKIANTSSLTALSVTIVVQRTTGISFSGQYNTVGGQITQSNSSTATAVTYQFNLAAGQTLSPGSGWTFAAQSSGTGTAHPVTGDTWTITYTTGGQSFTQSGVF
jgi:endoglucanase